MVVDHIHDHCQTLAVAGIHQPLQSLDPAVGVLGRPGINAVITPVALARELGDGQQLQRVHAQFPQFRQAGNDRVESALGGERSDVQFVHDPLFQRRRSPAGVGPSESVIDYPGWSVDALRLAVGSRIGAIGFAIPPVEVERTGFDAGDRSPPVALLVAGHGNQAVFGRDQMDGCLLQQGRP